MTAPILISISILLLLAYIFEVTSKKTKIPAVILLLTLGFLVRQFSTLLSIPIIDLNSTLPVLGTIGLILIVLEGSLELEINRKKLRLVGNSSIIAVIQLVVLSIIIAICFQKYSDCTFRVALTNAIPFAIVSSAIAIPSARYLITEQKEFITYESSFSDIFGVILFNFITLNDNIGGESVGSFFLELLVMLLVSFIATLLLALFLHRIKHHIKFIPIMLLIILIYAVSKIYHLPALIFILLFGLFIGNIDALRGLKFMRHFHPESFDKEVTKFKDITVEMVFLIRSLFFLLFGYLIDATELFNVETLIWAVLITLSIFLIRVLTLRIFKFPKGPLQYIAPRGLITILLFLSISSEMILPVANRPLVIQVIILTAIVMTFGLIRNGRKSRLPQKDDANNNQEQISIL